MQIVWWQITKCKEQTRLFVLSDALEFLMHGLMCVEIPLHTHQQTTALILLRNFMHFYCDNNKVETKWE